jgi:hypothetical protein
VVRAYVSRELVSSVSSVSAVTVRAKTVTRDQPKLGCPESNSTLPRSLDAPRSRTNTESPPRGQLRLLIGVCNFVLTYRFLWAKERKGTIERQIERAERL